MNQNEILRTRAMQWLVFSLAAVLLLSGCSTNTSEHVTGLPGIQRAPSGGGGGGGGIAMPAPMRSHLWAPMPSYGGGFRGGLGEDSKGRAAGAVERALTGSEELWVIAKVQRAGPAASDEPGSGSLMAEVEGKHVPMPLKHTEVKATVSGYIGTVDVRQEFHNPYSGKIEAVYVFPLPHNAAVGEFIMTIGERRIRGIVRERKEAERVYREARSQGYVASLLTEERPNVFKQSVANIEPGKQIDVAIRYYNTLDYTDGWYEFVFPMVVGPRFNPSGVRDGVGAVPRGKSGRSGQATEVPYLAPGEYSSHDTALALEVDAGVAIEEFECRTHKISTKTTSPGRISVALADGGSLPNKDFVFRYRVAGGEMKSAFMTHRDDRGGYFTLMLYPPKEPLRLARQPLELVFVLDCSGSMNGAPLREAKAAIEQGLKLLQPGDSFQLINFSMSASQLGERPIEASPENIEAGLRHLRSLEAGGGTMMIRGIEAALDFPHDPERLRFVCFLTDGYIGNETEILRAIHQRLGASRIFSFGIGSSVNRFLLDEMAKAGRGAVAYLGVKDSAPEIMKDFFTRISQPAMTDVSVDWGGLEVSEVFPSAVPDVFVGRPVVLAGRFRGSAGTNIRVNGKAGGKAVQIEIPVLAGGSEQPALANVWARMKISSLSTEFIRRPDRELPEAIKQVALDYGLLTSFTAFVAVDSTRRTEGSEGTTVPVAVPVPEGVKYETTVTDTEGGEPGN